MELKRYAAAAEFLADAQDVLEQNEAASNLMLGICLRLQQHPERILQAPYLATVCDLQGIALAATMTPPHRLVVYSPREPEQESVEMVVGDLASAGWSVPGVLGPAPVARLAAAACAQRFGRPYPLTQHQRTFALRQVNPVPRSPGALRQATEDDLPLVIRWTEGFHRAIGPAELNPDAEGTARRKIADRDLYLWDDGQPVSMAGHGRPTAHSIAVNMVYTPPEFRRRGYATSCVAALSQRLLDAGFTFCTLFTDLANPTSNDIYQRIGYRPICDYDEYTAE